MQSLMLLLALGLASADKLDRTYLPPPGSKFSGGSDGDLQLPFEIPKDTYSTTLRPLQPGEQNYEITSPPFEIDRNTGLPISGSQNIVPDIPGPQSPVDNLQNIRYKVPTTTTTYAFTQTSTFPPPQGFETTVSRINAIGLPSDFSQGPQTGLRTYQPTGQEQYFPQGTQPALLQPGSQLVQQPRVPNTGTLPSHTYQAPNQIFEVEGRPDYSRPLQTQSFSQYLPAQTFSTTESPFTESQAGFTQTPGQGYTQPLGVQPPRQLVQEAPISTQSLQDGLQGYQYGTTPNAQDSLTSGPEGTQQISGQQYIGQQIPGSQLVSQSGAPIYGSDLNNVPGKIVPGILPQDLSGQRPLFGGQPGPSQPGVSIQFTSNISDIPGINVPQQLGQTGYSQNITQKGIQGPYQTVGQQIYPISGSETTAQKGDRQNLFPTTAQPGIYPNASPGFMNQLGNIPQYIDQNNINGIAPYYNISQIGDQRQMFNQPSQVGQPAFLPSTAIAQSLPGLPQVNYAPPGTTKVNGYLPDGSVQPGFNRPTKYENTQLLGANMPPQLGILSSQQSDLLPSGRPGTSLQPTQIAPNQNQYQQTAKPGDTASIYKSTSSSTPTLVTSSSYASTTPGGILPTTLTPFGVTSTTPFPIEGQTRITSGQIRPLSQRPQAEAERNAEILSFKNILTPDGNFEYSFDTSNGIHMDENGTSIDGVKAEGSYSYIGDDGKLYSVVYSADENGFRPQGDHLPTPPPIPDAIQKVIEQAVKDKEAGVSHDGFYDEDKYGHKNYHDNNRIRPQAQDQINTHRDDVPNDYNQNIRPSTVRPSKRPLIPQGGRQPTSSIDEEEYQEEFVDNREDGEAGSVLKDRSMKNRLNGQIAHKRPGVEGKQDKTYTDGSDIGDSKTDNRYLPGSGVNKDRSPGSKLPLGQSINKPYAHNEYGIPEDDNESSQEVDEYTNLPHQIFDERDRVHGDSKRNELPKSYGGQNQYLGIRKDLKNKRPTLITSNYEKEEEFTSKPHSFFKSHEQDSRPMKHSGSQYSDSEDSGYYEDEQTVTPSSQASTRRPGSTKHPGFKQQNEKPIRPGTTKQDDELGLHDTQYEDNNDDAPRTAYDRKDMSVGTKYPSLKPSEKESGYKYLPPQTKFEVTERLPSRTPSEITQSSTRRPYNKMFNQKTTLQPFMTPNVSRDEEDVYDNSNKNTPTKKVGNKPGQIKSMQGIYDDTEGPEYEDKDVEEDLAIGDDDEYISSTKVRPAKPGSGSTTRHRPLLPSQQTTPRPKYGDKYIPGAAKIETLQPGTRGQIRYSKPGVPRPGQQYNIKENEDNTKRQGYGVTSETSLPSTSSTRGPLIRPSTGRPEYQTTYELDSSNFDQHSEGPFPSSSVRPSTKDLEYPDKTIHPSSTARPGRPDVTSLGPDYDYSDETYYDSGKMAMDTFRPGALKPSSRPGQQPSSPNVPFRQPGQPDYYKTSTRGKGSKRPGLSVPITRTDNVYYDQTEPPSVTPSITSDISSKFDSYYPGTSTPVDGVIKPGIQNVPSTTYRPHYTILDEVTGRLVIVDSTGRPIQPGTDYLGSTVAPGTNIDNYGPSQIPGQSNVQAVAQVLNPNRIISGQNFGVQRPVYSTTERIIGEDFSGPKQPQRFDPETGYHY